MLCKSHTASFYWCVCAFNSAIWSPAKNTPKVTKKLSHSSSTIFLRWFANKWSLSLSLYFFFVFILLEVLNLYVSMVDVFSGHFKIVFVVNKMLCRVIRLSDFVCDNGKQQWFFIGPKGPEKQHDTKQEKKKEHTQKLEKSILINFVKKFRFLFYIFFLYDFAYETTNNWRWWGFLPSFTSF